MIHKHCIDKQKYRPTDMYIDMHIAQLTYIHPKKADRAFEILDWLPTKLHKR